MAANEADRSKLREICLLSYKAQAIWFLNGFWESHAGEAEKFWAYVNKANSIDIEKHADGCALDELNAHRLLEMFDETLTVREMRTQLRSVGALGDTEHPKLVPLAHLLLARYKVDWHHFVNAPQGSQEEIDKAQAQLDACKHAFDVSNAAAAEAAEALRAAQSAEAAAKAREAEARAAEADAKSREAAARAAEADAKAREADAAQREAESRAAAADLAAKEAELRAAQDALNAALAEVQREEDAYNAKTAELKAKSETGGVVSMNKAKNELAQHLAGETLPLKKAKITAEAAAKRNERALVAAEAARQAAEQAARQAAEASAQATAARKAAEQAAAQATAARQAAEQAAAQATAARQSAEQARAHSESAKRAADEALAQAEAALAEAEAFLEEVKRTASGGKGALWWIERELHEQRKYLPTSRGGIAK